ncbi:CHRD domain-containing protein [Pedobacter nyackensis]|nr:CHRD domain-containing protein [Pedobacter nyackensis]
MKKFFLTPRGWQQLLFIVFISVLALGACKKNRSKPVVQDPIRTANVVLSGGAEVPAITTAGSGTATVSYNTNTKMITYQINWILNSTVSVTTDMHFHGAENGSATISSPVVIPITGFAIGNTGTLNGTTRVLTDAEANQLLAGKWYINVHSAAFPSGEIRGNIIFSSPNPGNPY